MSLQSLTVLGCRQLLPTRTAETVSLPTRVLPRLSMRWPGVTVVQAPLKSASWWREAVRPGAVQAEEAVSLPTKEPVRLVTEPVKVWQRPVMLMSWQRVMPCVGWGWAQKPLWFQSTQKTAMLPSAVATAPFGCGGCVKPRVDGSLNQDSPRG